MFKHIEFQSSPVFLLLVFASVSVCCANITSLSIIFLVVISVLLIVISCFSYWLKFKTIAFVLISFTFGLVFYINVYDSHADILKNINKIIPSQKSIFGGKVEKIIKSDKEKSRYLITGFIDTKSLKKSEENK